MAGGEGEASGAKVQVGKSCREDAAEGCLKKLRDVLCIHLLGGSSDDRGPPAACCPGRSEMAVSPNSCLPRGLLILTFFQLCKPDSGRSRLGLPLWSPHPTPGLKPLSKGEAPRVAVAGALRWGPGGGGATVAETDLGRRRGFPPPSVRPPPPPTPCLPAWFSQRTST